MDRRRLSVIVPAYNEADARRECLASLFAQIDEIHEVIVVDNNSTDQTQGVIAEFAALSNKFASVPATEQGVIFARTVGLDHATGDVLARIDADARVNPAWAKAVLDYFGKYGDTYQAGTGMCTIYDLPFQDGFRESHAKIAEETCRKLERGEPADTERLFGSNMAIKKSAWHQIRSMSSMRNDVHEDLDVTLCLKMLAFASASSLARMRRFQVVAISVRHGHTSSIACKTREHSRCSASDANSGVLGSSWSALQCPFI